jgi:hypothetical protein
MPGIFNKMTKAFNYVSSTLGTTKYGAKAGAAMKQAKYGFNSGVGSMKTLSGMRSMDQLKGFGKGMAGTWKGLTGTQKAGFGGAYGAAAGAGMAAADFLNPWGLGWGD